MMAVIIPYNAPSSPIINTQHPMKLKYNIAASVAAFILSQSVAAQQRFNEMTYSPNETTFRLNAPNKPTLRLYEGVVE